MKKRLLMVLGAGAGIECGMPSVAELGASMRVWAEETARSLQCQDYYEAVWAALENHLQHGFASGCETANFEKALSDLAALTQWVRPPPEGGTLRALAARGALPPDLHFPNPDRYGPYITLKVFAARLMEALATHMRARSRDLNSASAELNLWRAGFAALRERFDIALYTLNYDTIARSAFPDAITGFNQEGRFDPRAVHDRDWSGLFHLHGSVHFTLAGNASSEIVWQDNLAGDFSDCDDRVADHRSDGHDFAPTSFIAGGFKLDQLLVEPFAAYQSALVRDCARADAVLIGGYGFADAHVNRALRNALRAGRPRPPVLVLDRASADLMSYRQDRWAINLKQALASHGDYELRDRLQTSRQRVAVWSGGYLGACAEMVPLAAWLDGAPQAGA